MDSQQHSTHMITVTIPTVIDKKNELLYMVHVQAFRQTQQVRNYNKKRTKCTALIVLLRKYCNETITKTSMFQDFFPHFIVL